MTLMFQFRPHVNCLGDQKAARIWPGGQWECPFCQAIVAEGQARCDNPWCPASSFCFDAEGQPRPATVEEFRKHAAVVQREREEAEARARSSAWSRQWEDEDRIIRAGWVAEQQQEARLRGTCLRCLAPDPYRRVARFIKHRGPCPKGGGT